MCIAPFMKPSELKKRTAEFARRIVPFCTPLLHKPKTANAADQLLRSGTAVDANYGSAQCGRSRKEFRSKIGQVLDDAQESLGWLRLMRDTALVPHDDELRWLCKEADETNANLCRILPNRLAAKEAISISDVPITR
jgi:four helix bundle protein